MSFQFSAFVLLQETQFQIDEAEKKILDLQQALIEITREKRILELSVSVVGGTLAQRKEALRLLSEMGAIAVTGAFSSVHERFVRALLEKQDLERAITTENQLITKLSESLRLLTKEVQFANPELLEQIEPQEIFTEPQIITAPPIIVFEEIIQSQAIPESKPSLLIPALVVGGALLIL